MIQILPNIFAVEVPKDASEFKISFFKHIMYKNGKYDNWKVASQHEELYEGKYELLGTCTPTEIYFDVEPYCKLVKTFKSVKMYSMTGDTSYTNRPVTAFRSALTAAGIKQYDKLLILKKI